MNYLDYLLQLLGIAPSQPTQAIPDQGPVPGAHAPSPIPLGNMAGHLDPGYQKPMANHEASRRNGVAMHPMARNPGDSPPLSMASYLDATASPNAMARVARSSDLGAAMSHQIPPQVFLSANQPLRPMGVDIGHRMPAQSHEQVFRNIPPLPANIASLNPGAAPVPIPGEPSPPFTQMRQNSPSQLPGPVQDASQTLPLPPPQATPTNYTPPPYDEPLNNTPAVINTPAPPIPPNIPVFNTPGPTPLVPPNPNQPIPISTIINPNQPAPTLPQAPSQQAAASPFVIPNSMSQSVFQPQRQQLRTAALPPTSAPQPRPTAVPAVTGPAPFDSSLAGINANAAFMNGPGPTMEYPPPSLPSSPSPAPPASIPPSPPTTQAPPPKIGQAVPPGFEDDLIKAAMALSLQRKLKQNG